MRIKQIQNEVSPIHDPGLSESLQKSLKQGNIRFTSIPIDAVGNCPVLFIAGGTPSKIDGSANLLFVDEVATTIGSLMTQERTIVVKSTVPVGTARRFSSTIQSVLDSRSVEIPFTVVSNPEFLKEGAGLNDFHNPDRIIVGMNDTTPLATMRKLYKPLSGEHERLVVMSCESAELAK
jgi:UDPglucose 6-dehydrogenase